MFSRRRALDSRPRLISRTLTQTVTRYRSTWDGPVVDGETTTRHESAGSSGGDISRFAASALLVVGAAVALVYAQLVL